MANQIRVISFEREAQRENQIVSNPLFPQTALSSWGLVEINRRAGKEADERKCFSPDTPYPEAWLWWGEGGDRGTSAQHLPCHEGGGYLYCGSNL